MKQLKNIFEYLGKNWQLLIAFLIGAWAQYALFNEWWQLFESVERFQTLLSTALVVFVGTLFGEHWRSKNKADNDALQAKLKENAVIANRQYEQEKLASRLKAKWIALRKEYFGFSKNFDSDSFGDFGLGDIELLAQKTHPPTLDWDEIKKDVEELGAINPDLAGRILGLCSLYGDHLEVWKSRPNVIPLPDVWNPSYIHMQMFSIEKELAKMTG